MWTQMWRNIQSIQGYSSSKPKNSLLAIIQKTTSTNVINMNKHAKRNHRRVDIIRENHSLHSITYDMNTHLRI